MLLELLRAFAAFIGLRRSKEATDDRQDLRRDLHEARLDNEKLRRLNSTLRKTYDELIQAMRNDINVLNERVHRLRKGVISQEKLRRDCQDQLETLKDQISAIQQKQTEGDS